MPHWISDPIEDDSGLTNGLGVLDTMLVIDGVPQDIDLHLDRLYRDCRHVLRTPCPDVRKKVLDLSASSSGAARLRTVITGGLMASPLAGVTKPGIAMSLKPFSPSLNPITCALITKYPRIAGLELESCKRTDYARAFAARQDAQQAGFYDAILVNTQGRVACGTTSNLFIRENGLLITPPLDEGVVAGITRHKLIAGGAREELIPIERLLKAESVWLANSLMGLRPVSSVEIA